MLEINDELIKYLEDLSCLSLAEEEKRQIKGDLQKILEHMQRLSEVDTTGVIERSHLFDNINCFRGDEVYPSLDRELILKNAPRRNDKAIIAPRTVE